MKFGKAIRDRWLLDDDIIFLNHGSFGACPRSVLEVQGQWIERLESEPVRFITRELPDALGKVRQRLASFVGSNEEDLVFVENATTGVNAVLRSLLPELKSGDELLTTTHVYGAVRKTMEYIAILTGATVVEANVPFPIQDPSQVVEAIRSRITDRTRFAVIDHITSPTGVIYPVEEIVNLLKNRGIPVMIDGAHAPGMIELDVERIGADFYTGNCHKWLFAPKGAAFLWVSKEFQPKMHPVVISHPFGTGFQSEFNGNRKHIIGTRDPSAWLSVSAGLDFYESFGADELRIRNRSLLLEARKKIATALDTPFGAPPEMLGMICTVPLPGNPPADEQYCFTLHDTLFDEYKIEIPAMSIAGESYVRFSAQVYNESAEYDILISALQRIFMNGGVW